MNTALAEWGESVTRCFDDWRAFVVALHGGAGAGGAAAGGGAGAGAAAEPPSHNRMARLCKSLLDGEPALATDSPTRLDHDKNVTAFRTRLDRCVRRLLVAMHWSSFGPSLSQSTCCCAGWHCEVG